MSRSTRVTSAARRPACRTGDVNSEEQVGDFVEGEAPPSGNSAKGGGRPSSDDDADRRSRPAMTPVGARPVRPVAETAADGTKGAKAAVIALAPRTVQAIPGRLDPPRPVAWAKPHGGTRAAGRAGVEAPQSPLQRRAGACRHGRRPAVRRRGTSRPSPAGVLRRITRLVRPSGGDRNGLRCPLGVVAHGGAA
jgi:hypothetical protein